MAGIVRAAKGEDIGEILESLIDAGLMKPTGVEPHVFHSPDG
jgi:hypothetical protein